MKRSIPFALYLLLMVTGCDSPPPKDPLAAEREKLEKERAALNEEKSRLAEEQLAAQKAAADADARRLKEERAGLEVEKRRLAEEAQKIAKARAGQAAAEKSFVRDARKAEEQAAALATEAARSAEERRKLEALKGRLENERMAAERASGEARSREAAAKRAETAANTARTVGLFYEALKLDGDWLVSERHGYVWRPSRAVAIDDWRPYTDGRWQWTEYGWTWQSQEPFGWAVYHYGRWFRSPKLGWLWVPGTDWAPAWVAWRMKGSEYVGWAPLPPEAEDARQLDQEVDHRFDLGPWSYVFLPVTEFESDTYIHKFVPRDRQMQVLRGSRNLTRVAVQSSPQGPIVTNVGPDRGTIASVLREARQNPDVQPLPTLNLVFSKDQGTHKGGDAVEGGAMMLFAPKLEKKPAANRPKVGRDKVSGEADRGWGDTAVETEWRSNLEKEVQAARAAKRPPERLAAPPAAKAPPPPEKPTPRQPPPEPRPNPLNPARLQPGTPLLGR